MPVPSPAPVAGHRRGSLAEFAYRLGEWREREGDLEQAAGWFRRAAEFPGGGSRDAELRLGDVLGRLAEQRRAHSGRQSAEGLLAEGSRWLAGAQSAASPAPIELVTDMLNRHQRQAAQRVPQSAASGPRD